MSEIEKSRAWLEVDLKALIANYREAKSLLKPGVDMICVLKANAYGYGAVRVGQALYEEGVRFFSVATVPEAVELIDALPEDIRRMAPCVLSHRVAAGAGLRRADAEARLMHLVDQIPVPVEDMP